MNRLMVSVRLNGFADVTIEAEDRKGWRQLQLMKNLLAYEIDRFTDRAAKVAKLFENIEEET